MDATRSMRPASLGAADIPEERDSTASHDETDPPCKSCRRLAAERARYHDLFASSRDACVITDPRGVIRDANRRAGEMLGMPPSALHRKLLIAFVARGDTRAFRKSLASLAEVARTGSPVRVRMRARGRAPFDALLVVDGGWRSSSDEPALYRWTLYTAAHGSADADGLHDVLGAVARLARSLPAEAASEQVAPADGSARIGDSVARAILSMTAPAEQRRVRFAVDGADVPDDHVQAVAGRLDESVAALLLAALGATPDGAELRIRLQRDGAEVVLDVHVDGVLADSVGSALSVVLLATRLAADGGRLEVGGYDAQPLMRVRWPTARAYSTRA